MSLKVLSSQKPQMNPGLVDGCEVQLREMPTAGVCSLEGNWKVERSTTVADLPSPKRDKWQEI
jgi:hypothetical protein